MGDIILVRIAMTPSPQRFSAAAATSTGRIRITNEDRHLLDDRFGWFAVADGIGGLPFGERASECAVRSLRRELERCGASHRPLPEVIASCHLAVRQLGCVLNPRTGIGTTLTLLRLETDGAALAHIGDSAAYLHADRSAALTRLTTEHTVAAPAVAVMGGCASAFVAPVRLERYLGQAGQPLCDHSHFRLSGGERFILCSDGITRAIEQSEMATLSAAQSDPSALARALVRVADLRGGVDNSTALVVDLCRR